MSYAESSVTPDPRLVAFSGSAVNQCDSRIRAIPIAHVWNDPREFTLLQLRRHGFVVVNGVRPTHLLEDVHRLGLGSVVEQPEGGVISEVKQKAGYESFSDSRGGALLPSHVDGPFRAKLPLLGLFCDEPGPNMVPTLLGNLSDFLAQHEKYRHFAARMPFKWTNAFSDEAIQAPILSVDSDGRIVVRLSHNVMLKGCSSPALDSPEVLHDPLAREFLTDVASYFELHHVAISLSKGQLLLVDNGASGWLHFRRSYKCEIRRLRRLWLIR